MVSGTIYDGATNQPLEGAIIQLGYSTTSDFIENGVFTDVNGRYTLSLEAPKSETVSLIANKDFYIGQGTSFQSGKDGEYDFTLYPFDSDLEITFVNDSTPSGMVYVSFDGPLYGDDGYTAWGPQLVPYQTTLVKRFRVVGGQGVWVNWDTDLIDKFKYRDTVYCENRETTSWTIRF